MPIKRRGAKRRPDFAAELAAWDSTMDAGYDFFGDLPAIGVPIDYCGRPDRARAAEAWRRLGAAFLANPKRTAEREPWALTEFGDPRCR